MIITAISDCHGQWPILQGGDLLIVAGDCCLTHDIKEWAYFFAWFKEQKYRKKILVAGNHDVFLEQSFPKTENESYDMRELKEFLQDMGDNSIEDFEYLCDSGTEFEGLKIWGSPWQSIFLGQNPRAAAFSIPEDKLKSMFSLIPDGIDILITHSPPFGILDKIQDKWKAGTRVGSKYLLDKVTEVKPRLHVFGHIHGSYGCNLTDETHYYNCSIMNEDYNAVNKPWNIDIKNEDLSAAPPLATYCSSLNTTLGRGPFSTGETVTLTEDTSED